MHTLSICNTKQHINLYDTMWKKMMKVNKRRKSYAGFAKESFLDEVFALGLKETTDITWLRREFRKYPRGSS